MVLMLFLFTMLNGLNQAKRTEIASEWNIHMNIQVVKVTGPLLSGIFYNLLLNMHIKLRLHIAADCFPFSFGFAALPFITSFGQHLTLLGVNSKNMVKLTYKSGEHANR